METNTVLLPVEEYNRLRDFYNGIEDGKFVSVRWWPNGSVYYVSEKDVLINLKDQIEKLEKELKSFTDPDEKSIDDVKGMSIWQFIKWRKKNKT